MSFSSKVKEELGRTVSTARHCQMAELAAIMEFCGRIGYDKQGRAIPRLDTDNEIIHRKYFTLLKKTYNIGSLDELDKDTAEALLKGLGIMDNNAGLREAGSPTSPLLLKQSCCKRAFLRGAYLCAGSMSDPKGSYHLEFVCDHEPQAGQLVELLKDFGLEARITERKKHYVVYMKEGSGIVDFLGICEAHVALMEMENDRIVKEVRNSVNRRVNCEAANITKSVNAAAKQIEEIEYIRDHYGLDRLPDNLREVAEARLDNPDATLAELGMSMDPPLGKSGVNHRLRKISELAEKYMR